jgi:hypothetical protein
MKNTLLMVVGLTILSGCAAVPIAQEPIPYQTTKALHEKGTSNLTVRSVSMKDGYQELKGVPCELKADGFKSNFVTPAVVVTPDMGPRTPVASLTCTYGDQKFFQILQPVNDTVKSIDANASAAGAGAGIIGVIVSGIFSK